MVIKGWDEGVARHEGRRPAASCTSRPSSATASAAPAARFRPTPTSSSTCALVARQERRHGGRAHLRRGGAARARSRRCARSAPSGSALAAALGRVLAEDVSAPDDVPPHDNSAMDGFAVRAADARRRRRARDHRRGRRRPRRHPRARRRRGLSHHDRRADPARRRRRRHGWSIERAGDGVRLSCAVQLRAAHPRSRRGRARRRRWCSARASTLGAAELGMLASVQRALGRGDAPARRWRCSSPATSCATSISRSIRAPSPTPTATRSRRWCAQPAASRACCRSCATTRARSPRPSTRRARADLIVSTGGVSVGEHDHVKEVLAELGAKLDRVARGHEAGQAGRDRRLGAHALLRAAGQSGLVDGGVHAVRAAGACAPRSAARSRSICRARAASSTRRCTVRGERRQYLRARFRFVDGRRAARAPMPRQGSGVLTSMLGANGLVIVEPGAHALSAGAQVSAHVIGPLEC